MKRINLNKIRTKLVIAYNSYFGHYTCYVLVKLPRWLLWMDFIYNINIDSFWSLVTGWGCGDELDIIATDPICRDIENIISEANIIKNQINKVLFSND